MPNKQTLLEERSAAIGIGCGLAFLFVLLVNQVNQEYSNNRCAGYGKMPDCKTALVK